MAVTNLTKGLSLVAGAGALFGLGHLAKPYIWGNTISYLLKESNKDKQLLTSSAPHYSARWKKAWAKYRQDNKDKVKDTWSLGDWKKETTIDEHDVAPSSFVVACQTHSESRISSTSNPLYKEVLDWCTADAKLAIKELIKDSGVRALTDKDSKTDANTGWKPLLKNYIEKYKTSKDNPLGIEGLGDQVTEESQGIMDKFKEKCKALADQKVESNTDPAYEKVNNHCSAKIRAEDEIRDSYLDNKLINLSKFKGTSKVEDQEAKSLGEKLWKKYLEEGKDPWDLVPKGAAKQETIPDSFWDKCEDKRKEEVKGSEDKSFKEVLNYCTVTAQGFEQYAEKNT